MEGFKNFDNVLKSPEPLVIRGILDWSQTEWTLTDWKTKLHEPDKKFPFRKGCYGCFERPQWERSCEQVNLTMEDFFNLLTVDSGSKSVKPEYWYYFDYKHLQEWFSRNNSLKDISWSCFGLKDTVSSTIWIGSQGAHTPCHMDSYGHNLVAQLYGRKMWILFHPKMTDKLKPSRVPYEESSVYSGINFNCSCHDFSGLTEAHVVVLEPGDVLFVPKHWWHYVENLDTAISINSWLPDASDNMSRLEESLVKCIVTSLVKDVAQTDKHRLLNPNEDDLSDKLNFEELNYCLRHCRDNECTDAEITAVDRRLDCSVSSLERVSGSELARSLVKKCDRTTGRSSAHVKERTVCVDDVINAFCHPDVISLAREKLLLS